MLRPPPSPRPQTKKKNIFFYCHHLVGFLYIRIHFPSMWHERKKNRLFVCLFVCLNKRDDWCKWDRQVEKSDEWEKKKIFCFVCTVEWSPHCLKKEKKTSFVIILLIIIIIMNFIKRPFLFIVFNHHHHYHFHLHHSHRHCSFISLVFNRVLFVCLLSNRHDKGPSPSFLLSSHPSPSPFPSPAKWKFSFPLVIRLHNKKKNYLIIYLFI